VPQGFSDSWGVALVGAGAFGARRAAAASANPCSSLRVVSDSDFSRARDVAGSIGALPVADWREAVVRPDVGVVIVATPPAAAPEICFAALAAGKHVLVEKPFGRTAGEIVGCVRLANQSHRALKVGYNHRYHPALAQAYEMFRAGVIGRLLYLRCCYGHGGRSGYEREWRSLPEISGGGQLLDQGVHAIDLFRWFAGEFAEALAFLSTAYWPIAPAEDNVFALLRTNSGITAQLHASWTQWKNTFSFEIGGDAGTLLVTGLGRSYGPERLLCHIRRRLGGAPDEKSFEFPQQDDSLAREWDDFLDAINEGREPMSSGADAARTLAVVDGLYASAQARRIVDLPGAPAALEPVGAATAAGVRNA
jgi:predicted dehydrogenase